MEQFVVSARKYRPQTFNDVVGQQAITNTLINAIETNHLAQALLFTGPRGVGKTTCARILARKINQQGYDDPNEDFTFNVFELDAASNNSVDDIRSLIDQVRIPPQTGKYKVYIIDEVHMLSTSAFNAFLKTLEEPPAHAIFILATTEKHKILPTILSRCQIFDFKRITIKDAKDHLAEVAKSQNITFEDDALQIIAQKADGAMRDALSIFDRVVSFCGNHLTRKAVAENLNVLDFEVYVTFTDLILENKIPDLLLHFNDILTRGFDAHQFVIGLASHFRDLMVCKSPATLILLEAGEEAQRLFKEQAQKSETDFLLEAIHLANTCDLKYKTSQNQRLLVELCLMQLASITFEQKKSSGEFIIPSAFYSANYVANTPVAEAKEVKEIAVPETKIVNQEQQQVNQIADSNTNSEVISKFSIQGFQKKKHADLIQKEKLNQKIDGPVKAIDYKNLIEHWNTFAKKLNQDGEKIMYTYMVLDTPKLEENTIKLEFPNQSSKEDFYKRQGNLIAYLRENLENFELSIDISVAEEIKQKYAFTAEEKFEKLKSINPAIDVMRKLFELELN